MRVKIGDTWYQARPNEPIMLELTDKDKENIKNMAPDATKYAIYDEALFTSEEILKWMET